MKKIAITLSTLFLLCFQISCNYNNAKNVESNMKSDSTMYLDIKRSNEYTLISKSDINGIDVVSYTSTYGTEIRITTVPFIVPSIDFLSHILDNDLTELGGYKGTGQWIHEFCNDDKIQEIAANYLHYKNIIRANNDTLEYQVYNDSKFSYCIRTIKFNGAVANNDYITYTPRNCNFNKDDYQESYVHFLNSNSTLESNELQITNIELSQNKDSLYLTCSQINDIKNIELDLLHKLVYSNPYFALSLYNIDNCEFKPCYIVINTLNGENIPPVGIDRLFNWLHYFNTIAPIDSTSNVENNSDNVHSPGLYHIGKPQYDNPLR